MITLPPAWWAEISSTPVVGLAARRSRSSGRLEAVVDRVAHEVHERVAERVDHRAVELGVGADERELDLLAELARRGRAPGAGSAGRRPRPAPCAPA